MKMCMTQNTAEQPLSQIKISKSVKLIVKDDIVTEGKMNRKNVLCCKYWKQLFEPSRVQNFLGRDGEMGGGG